MAATVAQSDEIRTFQVREWKFQRIAWVLWALIVVAAGLGLLGPGPLSTTTAVSEDGQLTVEFERFVRTSNSTVFGVKLERVTQADKDVQLTLKTEDATDLKLISIVPDPQVQSLANNGVQYTFAVAKQADDSTVRFRIEHERFGRCSSVLSLAGGSEVRIVQYVFP